MADPTRDAESVAPYYDEGGVTIYHGDVCELLHLLPADGTLVTDPPYGIAHSSNRPGAPRRKQQIANDHSTDVRDTVLRFWGDRPAIVFGTCRAPIPPVKVRATLVWDKGGHVGMGDLALPWKQNWEHIYVSGQGFAGRRGSGVLRHNALEPWANRITHPHEKPVELLHALILKCPPDAVIVDPFMGSGTTLRAAKDLGRQVIGFEIEEQYCRLAISRLAQEVLDLGGAA